MKKRGKAKKDKLLKRFVKKGGRIEGEKDFFELVKRASRPIQINN